MGSQYFVANTQVAPACGRPQAVVVVDMVGDRELAVYRDFGVTDLLQDAIWETAEQLQVASFQPEKKFFILDDHTAFKQYSDTAVIIDFEYPHWHTTGDTIDKVSADSLAAIGKVLERWIQNGAIY